MALGAATITQAQTFHTAALNRDPHVQAAFQAYYNMDYGSALSQFEAISVQRPNDPLATDYVLQTVIFQELNRLDLLDTTFYANDGFLTGKHKVVEDPATKDRVEALGEKVQTEADAILARDPKNVDALYARGWGRSLEATYYAMVERTFVASMKLALSAKNDEQQVLSIDPQYADANLIVGVYQYVVGALPFTFRIVVGVAGISGSKTRGMQMLQVAAEHGLTTNIEARTCMMLFLRREAKYDQARAQAVSMATEFPHSYLFQLELANLEKDSGDSQKAIAQYRGAIVNAAKPGYFHSAHLQLAYFGLGDTLRGQRDYTDAATAFQKAAASPTVSPELKQRCLLNAGKTFDLMSDHDAAVQQYQKVIEVDKTTDLADQARGFIKHPYKPK